MKLLPFDNKRRRYLTYFVMIIIFATIVAYFDFIIFGQYTLVQYSSICFYEGLVFAIGVETGLKIRTSHNKKESGE